MELLLLLLFPLFSLSQLQRIQLSAPLSGGQRNFLDSSGRQRFFHGVNVVVKGPPWLPSTDGFDPLTSLVDQDFQLLQSLGLNVIRLGTMWPGAEPQQGQFNQTYLSQLRNITEAAAQYGIYSLLDMHQDVLSEKFCGEGVPAWAAYTGDVKQGQGFPWPEGPPVTEYWDSQNQFPLRSDCNKYSWGSLYFTNADGKAFQALYQNETGLRDAWAGFWTKVAETFVGASEILGIELMNEPWAGDADGDPLLLVPGVADKKNLQPAYDAISPPIWNVDPKFLIFFAAVTWDDIVPVGFDHAPAGVDNAYRSVFAFHYYVAPEGPQESLQPYFDQRLADAQRLGTGYMLTEFESQNFNQGPHPFDQVADEADKKLVSWAFWEFKDFCIHNDTDPYYVNVSQWDVFGSCKTGYGGGLWNKDGTVNMTEARHYARSYAQAVAGIVTEMSFNTTTGVFQLIFNANPTITLPTVIYVSEDIFYPKGYQVNIQGRATWKSEAKNFISVYNSVDSKLVGVTVTPL